MYFFFIQIYFFKYDKGLKEFLMLILATLAL